MTCVRRRIGQLERRRRSRLVGAEFTLSSLASTRRCFMLPFCLYGRKDTSVCSVFSLKKKKHFEYFVVSLFAELSGLFQCNILHKRSVVVFFL